MAFIMYSYLKEEKKLHEVTYPINHRDLNPSNLFLWFWLDIYYNVKYY